MCFSSLAQGKRYRHSPLAEMSGAVSIADFSHYALIGQAQFAIGNNNVSDLVPSPLLQG